jgi:HK97 family phage major capsid protein
MALPNAVAVTSDAMFSGYLEPEQAQDYFAEAEKTSIVQRFARKIPMGATGVKIPYWTGDVSAGWVGEGEMKPLTKGDFGAKSVTPHKIATIFTASAEVVRQNPANYLNVMRTKVATAIGQAFDQAVLYGVDSPFTSVSGVPQHLSGTSKVVPINGNLYDALAVRGLRTLTQDGKKWTASLLDDTIEPILNGSYDNNGRPLWIDSPFSQENPVNREGRIVSRPSILADTVASGNTLGFVGDFRQIVWGQVAGLSYSVSDQATLNFGTDEPGGQNFISLWQHNLVAVLVEAEFGLLVNDVEAFYQLTDGPLTYAFSINGSPTGGTFTLKVNGVETAPIAYNANDAAIKAAIVAVDDGIVAADVTVASGTITGPFALAHGTDALTGGTSPVTTVTSA